MDENAIKGYTDTIVVPCDVEKMKTLGTEEVPTEEGIYRAVLEVADVHGNAVYEEVYVVYDTTGAKIEDVADKEVKAVKEDLDKEPTVDKSDYDITDNVDGKVKADDIITELELRDAEKHEWIVHVLYIDRAGNESSSDFLITVVEATEEEVKEEEEKDEKEDDSDVDDKDDTDDQDDQDDQDDSDDKKDEDEDLPEEDEHDISPSEQKVIDAGYGNVVKLNSTTYAVLTHGNGKVNGVNGTNILLNYLETLDLTSSNIGGCWINSDNDWYWYIAYDVHELVDEDDDEYWDY